MDYEKYKFLGTQYHILESEGGEEQLTSHWQYQPAKKSLNLSNFDNKMQKVGGGGGG